MKYYKDTLKIKIEAPTVITLGKFDGLHRGHELLMQTMFAQAKKENLKTVVFTFNIPPRKLVGQMDAKVITTNPEKFHIFEETGLDYLIECPFTNEIRNMSPENFIAWMVKDFGVKCFVVGKDFRFAHNREGDYHTLFNFQKKYDYEVIVVEKIQEDARDISSTFIREMIETGNMSKANHLLGYSYFVKGEIVHGNRLGHTIGIPTINILMPDEKIAPKYGVYVSRVYINDKCYKGVTNVGKKPTIQGDNPVGIETYILDFDEDVYGKTAKVEFLQFVRDEVKFSSIDELKNQMQNDINTTARYYNNITD